MPPFSTISVTYIDRRQEKERNEYKRDRMESQERRENIFMAEAVSSAITLPPPKRKKISARVK